MIILAAWFVKYSKLLLVLLVIMIVCTPVFISYQTSIALVDCIFFSVGIAMGDSPMGVKAFADDHSVVLQDYSAYVFWLYVLRFLGWLIMPILVGLVVTEGQLEIDRRSRDLMERESLLLESREAIQRAFIRVGSDERASLSGAEELMEQVHDRLRTRSREEVKFGSFWRRFRRKYTAFISRIRR